MSQLFTGASHSILYKQFRPIYPPQIVERIIKYCRKVPSKFLTALDLGCGSGQSSTCLTTYFKTVIGLDPSESQIMQARSETGLPKNIEYRVGSAEDLSFMEKDTVDLITVAQAFHWVDTKKFYPEATRVLWPGGVVALYGYGNVQLKNSAANDIIKKFYENTLWGGGCWDERRHHIDNLYADFTPMPMEDFCRVDDIEMVKRLSVEGLVGYVSSWSGYQTWMKRHPESTILQDISSQLEMVYGGADIEVDLSWPTFLLMGRKSL